MEKAGLGPKDRRRGAPDWGTWRAGKDPLLRGASHAVPVCARLMAGSFQGFQCHGQSSSLLTLDCVEVSIEIPKEWGAYEARCLGLLDAKGIAYSGRRGDPFPPQPRFEKCCLTPPSKTAEQQANPRHLRH